MTDGLCALNKCGFCPAPPNHAHGNSGVRLEVTETLVEILNKGVTPYVCQKGSVGACGDLAPMSQIALLLMSEGKAYYKDELLEGDEAMKRAGIPIPGLMARDGLGTINGSNVLTAMSAIWLVDANNWLKQAEIAAAMKPGSAAGQYEALRRPPA